jgi:ABC-type transport system involved in multi-copper enzyme maturation permease subunit
MTSDSSMQIFSIFLMANLTLTILLVPALTSPSITTERENLSFDLLFTSLLSPGEILRGKLFAAIAMILLVIVVSMPVAAVCSLSGGISPRLLVRCYSVIAMSAFTYGILGLALSALCKRTFTSLILSYLGVILLAGGTWLPYTLLGRLYVLRHLWQFIRSISPFDALYSLIFPERYKMSQLSQISEDPLFTYNVHMLAMAILLGLFLFIFCRYVLAAPKPGEIYKWYGWGLALFMIPLVIVEIYLIQQQLKTQPLAPGMQNLPPEVLQRMRAHQRQGTEMWQVVGIAIAFDLLIIGVIKNMFAMAATAGSAYQEQFSDTKQAMTRKLSWPFYLIDPLKRKKPIGRFRNPVFVAELRSKIFGKPKFIIRTLAACIITSLILLILVCIQYADVLNPDTVRWVAVIFQLGIVATLAPAISSGSITDEVSSGTMLMLRMTPLSAVRVVFGKLKAAFLYVSIFLVSSLPVLGSLAYLEVGANYWRIGAWVAILVLSTLSFITAGLCASAFCRSTSAATAVSYCFSIFICIVTLGASLPGAFTPAVRQIVLTMNPMVGALRITSDRLFVDLPTDLWIHNMTFLGGISAVFVAAAAARVYYTFNYRQ